jgi:predicted dehydrogenase
VLGPLKSYTPFLAISHPEPTITAATGEPTGKTSTRTLGSGAVLSYHLRGGPAFASSAGAFWRIYGTEGEIQLTGPESYLQIAEDNVKIEIFVHASAKTEMVEAGKDEWSGLMVYGRNVARLYDAFADGAEGVLSWEEGVERQRFVEDIYAKAGVVV